MTTKKSDLSDPSDTKFIDDLTEVIHKNVYGNNSSDKSKEISGVFAIAIAQFLEILGETYTDLQSVLQKKEEE